MNSPLFQLTPPPHGAGKVASSGKTKPWINKADIILREAFPTLAPDTEYPFASGADWSQMDLVAHIISLIGPAHLIGATWSVAEAAAHKLVAAQRDGRLLSVRMLVDWRVQVRTPGFMAVAKANFTDVRVSSCHAKAFVLKNDTWTVSCVGSANFTGNPRIEAGHLSTTKAVGDFHSRWLSEEINKAEPFGVDMRKRGHDGRK